MKNLTRWAFCGVLAGGLISGAATAAPGQGGGKGQGIGKGQGQGGGRQVSSEQQFNRLDADGDGQLTQDEFVSAMAERRARMEERRQRRGIEAPAQGRTPPEPAEVFSRIDGDGDGIVTEAEFITHHKNRRQGRKGPGEGRGRRMGPPDTDDEAIDEPAGED